MKTLPLTIKILCLTYLVNMVSLGLYGQNQAADKKMADIESYKKYEITRFDKEDLDSLSKEIEITELVNYRHKSKNNLSGKVTETSKTETGEVKRTYYFNEEGFIFAMIDSVKVNDNNTKKLTYYFGSGKLVQIVDEHKIDVTSTIDTERLYLWIRKMFDNQVILK